MLKLIENTNDKYLMFNQYHEKFESNNHSQVTTATKTQLECGKILIECLDKNFFEDETLHNLFEIFMQKKSIRDLSYVEFKSYDKQDELNILLNELFFESKELKNQLDTIIVKLPVVDKPLINFGTNFSKRFISNNCRDERFLIFTNNQSLIELYEKL